MSKKIPINPRKLYSIITIAGIVGFLASFFQLLEKIEILKNPDSVLFCNINSVFSCSDILNVWQSSVFGFPNSLMCLIFFATTLAVGLVGWTGEAASKVLQINFMYMALFFVMFGFWYIWQSILIVGAICVYCIGCYGAVLIISASWVRLNYKELSLSKRITQLVDRLIEKNIDILFWIIIAIIIVIEGIIKFAQ